MNEDFHNFHRKTQRVVFENTTYFQKPRTLEWEKLFFGKISPLEIIFRNSLIASFFQLEFLTQEKHQLVKEIKKDSFSETPTPAYFQQTGAIIGYCFFFGLQDLNYQNLIFSQNRHVIIDVETVLANLITPSQTLLIPSKILTSDRCGLRDIFEPGFEISSNMVKELIIGFIKTLNFIEINLIEIKSVLLREVLGKHLPIRVILRDTKDYITIKPEMISEEVEQLKRGDIPYFFKLYNSNSVYYYINESYKYEEVKNLPIALAKKANIVGAEINTLCTKERINNQLLPNGISNLLNLFKHNLDSTFEIKDNKISLITIDKNEFLLTYEDFSFKLKI